MRKVANAKGLNRKPIRTLAFATFLVWRLRTGACGVGACGFWRYRMPPTYLHHTVKRVVQEEALSYYSKTALLITVWIVDGLSRCRALTSELRVRYKKCYEKGHFAARLFRFRFLPHRIRGLDAFVELFSNLGNLTHYRPAMPFGKRKKNILEDLWLSIVKI